MGAAYAARESWLRSGDADVTAAVERFADQSRLEVAGFAACLLDASPAGRIERIAALARELGVRGTPTWFVNGFPVMGDLPLEYARRFITDQLPG
jgi:protein-disulfide isomerase